MARCQSSELLSELTALESVAPAEEGLVLEVSLFLLFRPCDPVGNPRSWQSHSHSIISLGLFQLGNSTRHSLW